MATKAGGGTKQGRGGLARQHGCESKNFSRKFDKYIKNKKTAYNEGIELILLLNMFREAEQIKEYPYDIKTIITLVVSASFSIIMALLSKIFPIISDLINYFLDLCINILIIENKALE